MSYRILVADDRPASLYAMQRMVEAAGFIPVSATTGADAMALAGSVSASVLDVNLPDVNGIEVCRFIKANHGTPVVLVTASYADELHRSAGLSAGADEYLFAPVDSRHMGAILRGLLPPLPA